MKLVKAISLLAFWPAVLLGSCSSDEPQQVQEKSTLDSSGGADSIFKPDEPADDDITYDDDTVLDDDDNDDNDDDSSSEPPEELEGGAGQACEDGDECLTGFCMTTENIGAFINGAVVPNGYCSYLFCAIDNSDRACTSRQGGVCFSLYPFFGETYGDQGICLKPCDSANDCRTEDDNICFSAQGLADDGLLDQEIVDTYYRRAKQGCLPITVAEAAEEKLKEQQ